MSQQALDLRRSIQIVRRHKKLCGAMVAIGILAGAAYAVVTPPKLTSTALVVLPQSAENNQSSSSGPNTIIATQVVIASSDAVLEGALPHVSPSMSVQQLDNEITVSNPAGSIISITATSSTASGAENTANAVANSYVAYVSSASNPAGRIPATVLEPATTATGQKLPEHVIIYALLGALAGALIGFLIALAIGRNSRRLVQRDAIANSIAAPVLASLPVSTPTDAQAWVRLLEEYDPEPVDGWALNTLLQRLGVSDGALGGAGRTSTFSLTVMSLASDPDALALGPQLAAFAAARGIPTALVLGPQQDTRVTATLRTACAASPQSAGLRRPLRLIVSDDRNLGQQRVAFAVAVTVVDGDDPQIPDTARTTVTVLAVSAGAATAEQLARAATAAATDGREISGILVANPDSDDQTTGRVPRLAPPLRRQMPTRTNGVPMEIRR
jgi:capsular polysaccharide biosynthesis protein